MHNKIIRFKISQTFVDIHVRENSRAKRLSLRFHPMDGVFYLTKPPRAIKNDVLKFLDRSHAWIVDKLGQKNTGIAFVPGEVIPVLGVDHSIEYAYALKPSVTQKEGVLQVSGFDPIIVPGLVKDWLRNHVYIYIARTSKKFADVLGKPIGVISIKDTKTRWGSCSSHGNLAYSWRLAMAPECVVEYVCAHEVSHLVEMNHSPAFWHLVEGLCPEYKTHRQWLKTQGKKLFLYN